MIWLILLLLLFVGIGVLAYHPTLYWTLFDKVTKFIEKNKKKE